MRIRTQLFLGIATLMFLLLAAQWWLQKRQLDALEQEMVSVATTMGKVLVFGADASGLCALPEKKGGDPGSVWVQADASAPTGGTPHPPQKAQPSKKKCKIEVQQMLGANVTPGTGTPAVDGDFPDGKENVVLRQIFVRKPLPKATGEPSPSAHAGEEESTRPEEPPDGAKSGLETIQEQRIEFRVEKDKEDQLLIIQGIPGGDRQIPIPMRGSFQIVESTVEQGFLVIGVLLLLGLAAAALFAHRVTRPLRQLAVGVEAIGRGELGIQVKGGARGEVGELLQAFNQMSAQLQSLEAERARWQAREHLAQLGELARGLGHTLRNPLNTLGLVVDELAERVGADNLVTTARTQIRRIDNWLRSFLAVGAGQGVELETIDLTDLVQDVGLETLQQGREVVLEGCEKSMEIKGIRPGLRAALSNLLANAVEASPPDTPVRISLSAVDEDAIIQIVDRGPGLPESVREQLFSPHVTTKAGGSGMGVFLARQLIEGIHGGRLTLRDGPETGTVAEVRIPLARYRDSSQNPVPDEP